MKVQRRVLIKKSICRKNDFSIDKNIRLRIISIVFFPSRNSRDLQKNKEIKFVRFNSSTIPVHTYTAGFSYFGMSRDGLLRK